MQTYGMNPWAQRCQVGRFMRVNKARLASLPEPQLRDTLQWASRLSAQQDNRLLLEGPAAIRHVAR